MVVRGNPRQGPVILSEQPNAAIFRRRTKSDYGINVIIPASISSLLWKAPILPP